MVANGARSEPGGFIDAHRRVVRDYRLAFGRTIAHLRQETGLSFADIADQTGIPEITVRDYARGAYHPQIHRLIALARVFKTTVFTLLVDTSDQLFHAHDYPAPDRDRDGADIVAVAALLLYSGASLDDVNVIMTNDYDYC